MTNKKNGHGGARPGAGRPRSESSIVKANQFVQKKMRGLAEEGWEALAESYPDLMRTAINEALGGGDKKPNIVLLKTLIEMPMKLVSAADEEKKTAVALLLEQHLGRVRDAAVPSDIVEGQVV